ncbi:MAG: hypothetical protein ACREIQ_01605 [Nitrospiria bacterium]
MKKTILIIFAILVLLPTGVLAHQHRDNQGLLSVAREELAFGDFSNLVRNLAVSYSQELQRGANTTGLEVQPALDGDAYLMDGQRGQARMIAETALQSMIRQRMEQVEVLHILRTYGERLTSAQLRVTDDRVEVSGLSVRKPFFDDGMGPEVKRTKLTVQSGMSLTDHTRIAMMIQARMATLDSKVIYDPMAGGDWRFSLGRSMAPHSTVEMVYLLRSMDDQNLLATLRLSF